MVRHMDRDVLLVVALLSLLHYDPVQENRFTCSVNVFATSFRSNGQA